LAAPIEELIKTLAEDVDWEDRRQAALALGKSKDSRAFSNLVKALDDVDDDVRQAAVLALGRLGDQKALDHLLRSRIFYSNNPDIRWAANMALGQIGVVGDMRLVEHLLQAAEDEHWVVRNAASSVMSAQIRALEAACSPDSVQILLRILATSRHDIHDEVVRALTEAGRRDLDLLLDALHSLSENVRKGVARVLAALGDRRAGSPLVRLLNDPGSEVRQAACDALGDLVEEEAIPGLVMLLNDASSSVRTAAARALRKMGRKATIPLVAALRTAQGRGYRRQIVHSLGVTADPRAMDTLIACLGESRHVIRRVAVEALARLKSPELMERLFGLLAVNPNILEHLLEAVDKYPAVSMRRHTILALGELRDDRAVPILHSLLSEGEPVLADALHQALAKIHEATFRRLGAANVLGIMGDPAAVTPLVEALEDNNRDVRWAVVKALGKIGNQGAIPGLIGRLADDAPVRREAVRILGEIGVGKPEVVDALIPLLENSDAKVRSETALALGRLSDPRAIAPLKSALDDPYWSVSRDAGNALSNLGVVTGKA